MDPETACKRKFEAVRKNGGKTSSCQSYDGASDNCDTGINLPQNVTTVFVVRIVQPADCQVLVATD